MWRKGKWKSSVNQQKLSVRWEMRKLNYGTLICDTVIGIGESPDEWNRSRKWPFSINRLSWIIIKGIEACLKAIDKQLDKQTKQKTSSFDMRKEKLFQINPQQTCGWKSWKTYKEGNVLSRFCEWEGKFNLFNLEASTMEEKNGRKVHCVQHRG